MGENSSISWTTHTWNPWVGCTKVSEGCKNCYMFREMEHYGKNPLAVVRSKTTFAAPLKWKEPARIFTCSWSDFFHESVQTDWLDDAWDIIRKSPHLTYQILTKRPQEIKDALPDDWGDGWPNVWLGVSIENEKYTWRMESLADVPAHVRFISHEPSLGDISKIVSTYSPVLHWIIAGGESGAGYRPMNLDWVWSLYRQCKAAGVAFFMKQDSAPRPGQRGGLPDELWNCKEFPITNTVDML